MFGKNSSQYKIRTKNGWENFDGILLTPSSLVVRIFYDDLYLDCTIDHKIQTKFGFRSVGSLIEGDVIETDSGYTMIKKIEFLKEKIDVYDVINAGQDHSYYSNGVLSHNCEFLGSGFTLISGAKLRQLQAGWKNPVEKKETGHLRIYERPLPGHTYAMTCDVATGKGGDAQAFSVIDITEFPFKQVAVFDDNTLYYMLYPNTIYNVAKFYNEAFVLIEINDVGQAVSYMMQAELGYNNLIKIKQKGKQGQTVSGGFQKQVQFGLKQTTATKRIGCAALKALVESNKLLIPDEKTVKELMTFVEDTNSFAADPGATNAKDDIVMSLVLFGWLSDQQFFKDACGNNIRENLVRQIREVEDVDFVPFGFIDDGLNHTADDALDHVARNPAEPWSIN